MIKIHKIQAVSGPKTVTVKKVGKNEIANLFERMVALELFKSIDIDKDDANIFTVTANYVGPKDEANTYLLSLIFDSVVYADNYLEEPVEYIITAEDLKTLKAGNKEFVDVETLEQYKNRI